MGNKILILGDSGSGKSTSTRTLDHKATFYINVIGKPLPFKGWRAKYKEAVGNEGNLYYTYNADQIVRAIKSISVNRPEIKTIIVDDAQYIMSFEFMDRAAEKGWEKFTDIGKHMLDVLNAPDDTREDLTTIFLTHSDDVSVGGNVKTRMKTIGKLLDEKICIEGLFTIVLLAYPIKQEKDKKMKYVFVTQSNGTTVAKSPMDMFDSVTIDNDLAMVLDKVKEYEEG